MNLKNAIDVLKEAKYIGSDKYATDYDKRMNEAIDTVVAEVETKNYTEEDMEAFAEWCSENGWNISIKKHRWVNDNSEGIFTKQLREMWEQERKEPTEL